MKEYKITVKPYLQKRVKPHIVKVYTGEDNRQFESHEGWPLYYQVIYKRKNTHIRSSFMRNQDKTLNHFSPTGGVFVNSGKMDTIIEKETKVIKSIIRYLENTDEGFELAGFGSIYQYYSRSLHKQINKKLIDYLQINLALRLDSRITDFFNFKNGTYYSIYKYSALFFGHLDLFDAEDIERFELIKKFFDFYVHNEESFPNHLKHHFEVPSDFFNDPLVIDYFNGTLKKHLSESIAEPKFIEGLIIELGKVLAT
jgi:hypothetical protein